MSEQPAQESQRPSEVERVDPITVEVESFRQRRLNKVGYGTVPHHRPCPC